MPCVFSKIVCDVNCSFGESSVDFLETDFVIVNLSRSVCLVSVLIQERTPSSHANIQAPLTDFPSDLDIDVQTPDGVVVELQLHKSAITDDVPLLVMRNGGIVRIPLPSTDVSTRHNGVATVCKVGWLKLCPKTIYFIRHSVLEVGLKT